MKKRVTKIIPEQYIEAVTEIVPEVVETIPAVLDESGEIIEPARQVVVSPEHERVVTPARTIPAYRTSELVDLTAEEIAQIKQVQVPQVVSMKQARKALILAGISIDSIMTAFAAMPNQQDRDLAIVDWETSGTVRRSSTLVASMAAALGLDSATVDNLFIAAAGIAE